MVEEQGGEYKTITITNFAAEGLPVHETFGKQKRFYLQVTIDDAARKTGDSDRTTAPKWTESFHFAAVSDGSTLKLEVYEENTFGSDKVVGTLEANVFALLKAESDQSVSCSLRLSDNGGIHSERSPIIKFRIACEKPRSVLGKVESTAAAVEGGASKPLEAINQTVDLVQTTMSATQPATDFLLPLLDNMTIVVKLVDKVAELHPYADGAWKILSSVYQIAKNQQTTDAGIIELVATLGTMFDFVTEAEATNRIHAQKRVLLSILKQTTECAYFIQDYFTRNKQFMKRAIKSVFISVDGRVQGYCDTLTKLKTEFLAETTLHTELTIFRLADALETLPAEVDLSDMRYAAGARYDPKKLCLPDTRTQIISKIIEWVNDDHEDQPRILLLQGGAGTGKSTIAHTIAAHFEGIRRLGSSYCFDKSRQTELNPENLFSTIARDLADRDPPRKKALWEVIKDNRSLRSTRSADEQFDNFIVKPSEMVTAIGPNLVMIDGLDESADVAGRSCLIEVFANKIAELPSGLKFIVTSRAEFDVVRLSEFSTVRVLSMEKIDETSTSGDIRLFVRHNLKSFPEEQCDRLAEKAEGLFQWAFTACNYIIGPRTLPAISKKRLSDMLTLKSKDLDVLYTEILTRATENTPEFEENYSLVITRMLTLFRPLPINSLQCLRSDLEPEYATAIVINELGSLLHGVYKEDSSIRPIHTSFRDYLLDYRRSGRFFVQMPEDTNELASRCLDIMDKELTFNIAHIPSSYLPNSQLDQQVVNTAIPPHLLYACEYFALHITGIPTKELIDKMSKFLGDHFLHWLEVLSLKDRLSGALTVFYLLQNEPHYMELADLGKDGQRFVTSFFQPIAMSAPHIYTSAISFTPAEAPIRHLFRPPFGNVATIEIGGLRIWRVLAAIIEGHSNDVNSITFSSNGKQLASGSSDATVRLWDVESGKQIGQPLRGHSSSVNSVNFSRIGKLLASGSSDQTVRLWNVESGKPIGEPLKGHSNGVTSVTFSPDGKRLASASVDQTVRLWDVESGKPVGGPLKGHSDSVTSVAFSSPDGKQLASASSDETVRLWDAESGKPIGEPLEGHWDSVKSVAYSPTCKQLASASVDKTVRLWDVESGQPIGEPLGGHLTDVNSVTFSPDGKRLASASWDHTVRLWDVVSGEQQGEPLEGHSKGVNSVTFSLDGRRFASASSDATVLLWDLDSHEPISKPLDGHSNGVTFVTFSLDGKQLASASFDQTVRVWDVESGKPIGKPLEGHLYGVTSVTFSSDGKQLTSASWGGLVWLWDIESCEIIGETQEGYLVDGVTSVNFSPNGKRLISAAWDGTLHWWDVESSEPIEEPLEDHLIVETTVAFSPDRKQIASASPDHTVRLWNVETGEQIGKPLEGHCSDVTVVTFSPDGKRLASVSSDKTVRLWDVGSGRLLGKPLEGHSSNETSVTFSSDGKRLASVSSDRTIRLWDVESGRPLGEPLQGHSSEVTSVAFSRDGQLLASGSADKTVRLWTVEPSQPMREPLKGDFKLVESSSHSGYEGLPTPSQPDTKSTPQISVENFPNGCRLKNGWLLGPNSELILWIPPWHRENLWWEDGRQKGVIAKKQTKLSWANFKHGPNWADGVA